jgi:hypothetical protein
MSNALPPEIAALLQTYRDACIDFGYSSTPYRSDKMEDARSALETAITALVRDGERMAFLERAGTTVQASPDGHTQWSQYALPGTVRATIDSMQRAVDQCRAANPRGETMTDTKCDRPPSGWYCTRTPGHDGPCAAHPGCPRCGVSAWANDRCVYCNDPRPVSPEAAPPRATTVGRSRDYLAPDDQSRWCPTCSGSGLIPRASLSAAPSQEIGGLLLTNYRNAVYSLALTVEQSQTDDRITRDELLDAHALEGATRAAVDQYVAALSVDAREAERLRAAAEKVVAAWEAQTGAKVSVATIVAMNALRASLRATPPETTTQETKP